MIRPFQPDDWNLLLGLANQAVPFAPKENAEWLGYRKAFDESTRTRRHYIAVENGHAVGYGGLEQQADTLERLRVYVVCDPQNMRGDVGNLLFAQLLSDARTLGADQLWAREFQVDENAHDFFTRQGFAEARRFTVPDQPPLVIFELDV